MKFHRVRHTFFLLPGCHSLEKRRSGRPAVFTGPRATIRPVIPRAHNVRLAIGGVEQLPAHLGPTRLAFRMPVNVTDGRPGNMMESNNMADLV